MRAWRRYEWALITGIGIVACGPTVGVSTTADGSGSGEATTSSSTLAADGSTAATTGGSTVADPTTTSSTGDSTTTGGPGFYPGCEGPLSASWDAWEDAVAQASGSHGFSVVEALDGGVACFDPSNPACALRTTMSVQGEQVVSRTLEVEVMRGVEPGVCPEPYMESDVDVGTHPDGFAASTLSEVYAECCALAEAGGGYWIGGAGEGYQPNDVQVELDEEGFIAACSLRYCDFCGCTTDTHFEIDGLFVGR